MKEEVANYRGWCHDMADLGPCVCLQCENQRLLDGEK